jgi:hypothetical protein
MNNPSRLVFNVKNISEEHAVKHSAAGACEVMDFSADKISTTQQWQQNKYTH